jgi:hypothetical protein
MCFFKWAEEFVGFVDAGGHLVVVEGGTDHEGYEGSGAAGPIV